MFRTVREDKERLSLDEDEDDEEGVVVLSAPFSGGLPIPAALLDVVLAGVAAGSARDDGVREGVAGTAQREGERERLAAAGDPPAAAGQDGQSSTSLRRVPQGRGRYRGCSSRGRRRRSAGAPTQRGTHVNRSYFAAG